MRYRIVALADSLALPREEADEILRWEETWPYLLESDLCGAGLDVEVINCGARARTSRHLVDGEFKEHVLFKRPDMVITQFGVTDSLPRVFSPFEKRVMNLPGFPARVRTQLIARRSRRRREITRKDPLGKVHVVPAEFERFFRRFCADLAAVDWDVDLIVMPILTHPVRMERKSPRQNENVRLYNDILRRVVGAARGAFLEPADFLASNVDAKFFSDGYHLTPAGSREIATALEPLVKSAIEARA